MAGAPDPLSQCLHATAIAVGGRAALIRGPSGSGKSDLALRCLTLAHSALLPNSAALVSDDQVLVTRTGLTLEATAPAPLLGKLEIRGLGIVQVPVPVEAAPAQVVLVVDLAGMVAPERLPDPWPTASILGLQVPLLRLAPFEASAAAKLVAALTLAELPPAAP